MNFLESFQSSQQLANNRLVRMIQANTALWTVEWAAAQLQKEQDAFAYLKLQLLKPSGSALARMHHEAHAGGPSRPQFRSF